MSPTQMVTTPLHHRKSNQQKRIQTAMVLNEESNKFTKNIVNWQNTSDKTHIDNPKKATLPKYSDMKLH
jgi:hypothetical protein